MSNDNFNWKEVGLGAGAAGLGGFFMFRKGKPVNKVQQLARGRLNWVTEYPSRFTTDRKTFLDRVIGRLLYGDTKFYKVTSKADLKKLPRKLEGATYYELDTKFPQKYFPKSDISLNQDLDTINKVFQDKAYFSSLKGKSIVKGTTVDKKVGKAKNQYEFFDKLLSNKKSYIKPRQDGGGSAGYGHLSSAEMEALREVIKTKGKVPNAYYRGILDRIYKNPKKYVIQEEIELAKTPYGAPKTERRIDFVYHNGQVFPIQKHRRWYGFDFTRVKNKEFKKEFENLVKANPSMKKKLGDKAYLLGADVAKDKKGRLKIIEVNDQSGFLDPTQVFDPFTGHRVYRRITGRDTKLVRGLKGTVAGTSAYVGGDYLVDNVK